MFDFESENTSAKVLFAASGLGGIAVAWNQNLLFVSLWPWVAFCFLSYVAEAEDITIYGRKKSMSWLQAMVFRANDDGSGKVFIQDTFTTRLESLFYFCLSPIYRGYQAIVLAGLIGLVAYIVIAIVVFVLVLLSILPAGRF